MNAVHINLFIYIKFSFSGIMCPLRMVFSTILFNYTLCDSAETVSEF